MGRRHIPTEEKRRHNAPLIAVMADWMARHRTDQNDLARELGVTHGTVSRWLSSAVRITPKHEALIHLVCGPPPGTAGSAPMAPAAARLNRIWPALSRPEMSLFEAALDAVYSTHRDAQPEDHHP